MTILDPLTDEPQRFLIADVAGKNAIGEARTFSGNCGALELFRERFPEWDSHELVAIPVSTSGQLQ